MINHLLSRFSDLYDPHQEVAVDEAMIKFTGRSTLKQYMPLKPVKRGIKVWALADSHNGYFTSSKSTLTRRAVARRTWVRGLSKTSHTT